MADHEIQQPIVETRSAWNDAWTVREYLWCNRISLNVSPDIDSAELTWDYGEIMKQGDPNFLPYPSQDLRGHYVRITWQSDAIGGTQRWHGVITNETEVQLGTNAAGLRTGAQSFTAVGLEWLLDRDVIYQSLVDTQQIGTVLVDRVLNFNAGGSTGRNMEFQGNRSKTDFVFARDLGDATTWDAAQICFYLLEHFSPKDSSGAVQILFTLPLLQALDLQQFTVQVQAGRRTVKQVLDSLISRYRGLSYTIEVTPTNAVALNVFSWVASDVPLPGGGTLTGNTRQRALDLEDNLLVRQPTITHDSGSRYERIIARGDRATTTFTTQYQDGLDRGWEESAEATYITGASDQTGYAALDIEEQQQWDIAVRSSDLMRKVFSYLIIDPYWPGTPGDQPMDPLGNPYWLPGLRFLPYTLLKEYHDYAGANIANDATLGSVPFGTNPDFRLPFGVVSDVGNRWLYIDRLSQQGEIADTAHTDGRNWLATIRIQDDWPGIVLQVNGAAQHVMAKDDFEADHEADEDSESQPELAWQDIRFTVSMELDFHCEASFPPNPVGAGDYSNTKTLYIPNMRLDYVVPGTVVDIAADGELITSGGGYVQDDREKLADIARMAWEWYQRDRVSLSFAYSSTRLGIMPGELITAITTGGTTMAVNTLVTQVMLNFDSGTSSVTTGKGEFDAGELLV